MIYFLDTSIVSQLVREEPAALARLAALGESDRIMINTIVRGEIVFGIQRLPPGVRRQALQDKVDALLASLICEPVPPPVAEEYAAVKNARQRKGMSLDENDLWIAASARFHGATLVTRDRDFHAIDGIVVESWSS